jgi:carbamoyl-phosphate synthase large subunit
VAQTRKRLYWEFSNRSPSGVTGLTGTGVTVSDPAVDDLAIRAIHAIDACPHGVWSVDMTYDREGCPNPTEINIGRFFTTHLFFSQAGLNMPYILVKLAFGEEPPLPEKRINPLPDGLAWIRGMDIVPILTTTAEIESKVEQFNARREALRNAHRFFDAEIT